MMTPNLQSKIIRYEKKELSSYEIVIMFSQLKKANISYNKRELERLIKTGWIHKETGNINIKKMKLLTGRKWQIS